MEHVDGNVLAGPLSELFRFDLTMTSGECRHCGDVRCCSCGEMLMAIVTTEKRTWLDLSGISGLQIPS